MVKCVYTSELPQEPFSWWDLTLTMALGGNLLASYGLQGNTLAFVRLPSAMSRTPAEWWSSPVFPFDVRAFAAHLPDNVLAVAEKNEQ